MRDTDGSPNLKPEEARRRLAELVRMHRYEVRWSDAGKAGDPPGQRFYRLALGADWTLPLVVLRPATPGKGVVIMLADGGRKSLAAAAERASETGRTVIAADPVNIGENAIPERGYLWALLLSGLGDRLLGVQASQVQALARAASEQYHAEINLEAFGPRTSLIALVAAALNPDLIRSVKLSGARSSFKELIEQNITVDREPESFCFGLLEQFDIPNLRKLARVTD